VKLMRAVVRSTCFVSVLIGCILAIGVGRSVARPLPFLPPSAASAVVVGATNKGTLVVLPTMAGPGIKLGAPGTVAVHPKLGVVYAAPEWGRRSGKLITASLTGRRLKELTTTKLGGTGAVSISVSPDATLLVVANYGSGSVSVVPLDQRGMPSDGVAISLPSKSAVPHAATFVGTNVVVTDLRNNRLDVLDVSNAASPRWIGSTSLRLNDGPRSIAKVSERQILVSNENSNTVVCLLTDGVSWVERGRLSLAGSPVSELSANVTPGPTISPAAKGRGKPAEIVSTSPTVGAVVVRNPDEVVIFSVSPSCEMEVTGRVFDVVDSPRAIVHRGSEMWLPISSAVMVSTATTDWAAIPTREPLYSLAVVR
jgi:hypothetical protein